MRVVVFCRVLFLMLPAIAYSQSMSKGFDHFYNLEYDAAIAEFEKEIGQRPEDPHGYNHLAQAILYRELYKAGALESELVSGSNALVRSKIIPQNEEEQRFYRTIDRAVRLGKQRMETDAKDLDAIYAVGVARGLRANYDFLIRKLWRASLKEFTESRKLHNLVTSANPAYIDAYLVEGVHDYIVGSLPMTWKFFGFLMGFRGDKEGGIETVKMVAEKGTHNRVDAKILLAVVYRREKQPAKAISLLEQLVAMFPRNHLYRLEMVQMHSDLGNKDAALAVLNRLDELRRTESAGFQKLPAAKIDYARGNLLFWYRDYAAALVNLSKVTSKSPRVDISTGMNAWLRTGQILDLQGKRTEAKDAYRQAIQVAPDSDTARESRRYLSSPYKRSG